MLLGFKSIFVDVAITVFLSKMVIHNTLQFTGHCKILYKIRC